MFYSTKLNYYDLQKAFFYPDLVLKTLTNEEEEKLKDTLTTTQIAHFKKSQSTFAILVYALRENAIKDVQFYCNLCMKNGFAKNEEVYFTLLYLLTKCKNIIMPVNYLIYDPFLVEKYTINSYTKPLRDLIKRTRLGYKRCFELAIFNIDFLPFIAKTKKLYIFSQILDIAYKKFGENYCKKNLKFFMNENLLSRYDILSWKNAIVTDNLNIIKYSYEYSIQVETIYAIIKLYNLNDISFIPKLENPKEILYSVLLLEETTHSVKDNFSLQKIIEILLKYDFFDIQSRLIEYNITGNKNLLEF